MTIRPAIPADVPVLAALYAASVRALGSAHYTESQVEAWAAFAEEPAFRSFVLHNDTLVAEDEAGLAGFAGLGSDGRIASLYVHPRRIREGVASSLLEALLARARAAGLAALTTEASALSRPVFERFGFQLVEVETVERRGVQFDRYLMRRELERNREDEVRPS